MSRHSFQPSVHSQGSTGRQGDVACRPVPVEDPDLGVLVPSLLAHWWARNDVPDDTTPAALAKKYWWVILLSLPAGYVAVNRALDFVGDYPGAKKT